MKPLADWGTPVQAEWDRLDEYVAERKRSRRKRSA